jgi:hypothetical protein
MLAAERTSERDSKSRAPLGIDRLFRRPVGSEFDFERYNLPRQETSWAAHDEVRMRNRCWVLAALVMAACSGSSPATPTTPAMPEFSIHFALSDPARVSWSEPTACPGDWSTCARDSQPQGPGTTSQTTMRSYSLPPGTYRLTGMLHSSTSIGASVNVRIASGTSGSVAGGVAHDVIALGVFGFTGEPSPRLPSVVSQGCAATFWTPPGTLEWSIAFRVTATFESASQLCL